MSDQTVPLFGLLDGATLPCNNSASTKTNCSIISWSGIDKIDDEIAGGGCSIYLSQIHYNCSVELHCTSAVKFPQDGVDPIFAKAMRLPQMHSCWSTRDLDRNVRICGDPPAAPVLGIDAINSGLHHRKEIFNGHCHYASCKL
jgi:hypothetical protein